MEKERSYSFLTLKAVNEEKREFTGIASTPEPDRVNDVMVPKGAKFRLPLTFLWQHDHDQPIGEIYEAKVTDKGIEVKGRIKQVSAPSQLAARLDEAWVSMKEGLVRGLSIGFRPLKYAFLDSGGIQYDEWEWYELSAVTIPANADGRITSVKDLKSLDAKAFAKQSEKKPEDMQGKLPSKALEKKQTVKLTPKEGINMSKTISEQLADFRATLATKSAKLGELAAISGEAGETFDGAQQDEFDNIAAEVKELKSHIERLEIAEQATVKTAKPVVEKAGQSEEAGKAARHVPAVVKTEQKLEKGMEFARYAMCLAAAQGNPAVALEHAKNHYSNHERVINALTFQAKGGKFEQAMKANVIAGNTLDSTWAAPLVQYQDFTSDFVEFLRPRTILGQFGQNGVPALTRIPFNVRIAGQTSGGQAYWVGEGKPKPLTKFDFNDVELRWAKIAAISVITEELIRFSNPSAERLVRDGLADAVIALADTDFINPAKAAVSNVSPASITNGANTVASDGGTDAEAVRCDLQKLWAFFITARIAPRGAVYIMDSTTALAVSMLRNVMGGREFPDLTINGGSLDGIPVIVSDYVPAGTVVLVNASDIWLSDDGQVTIDVSREASLQMLDNPTNDTVTPTATSLVSMFQTNSVAIRAERYMNWARRRNASVAYLTGVNWGACEVVS